MEGIEIKEEKKVSKKKASKKKSEKKIEKKESGRQKFMRHMNDIAIKNGNKPKYSEKDIERAK